jgi:hypothetical protein
MARQKIECPRALTGLRLRAISLSLSGALASCASRPDAVHAPASDASVAAADPPAHANGGTPTQACVAVMHRTRECEDVYVPGLLGLRVRLDLPRGIAERFSSEGESAMLELAHSQFSRDWSDDAITRNCTDLSRRDQAEQEAIVAPDRHCLEMTDCNAFTTCDLAHKEKRWTETQ